MSGRWTIFFENPNMTATVLAELAVAFLCLSSRFRALGKWLLVAMAVVSAVALAKTGSRGGFFALLLGVGVLAVARGFEGRRGFREAALPLAAVLTALVAASAVVGLSHRLEAFAEGHDASVNNRLLIWRKVPQMMADASAGWGIGRSGRAFMDWYQPLDRTERYRTLVGSHATWLVEFGGWGRTLYVFGWLLVLFLAFRRCWGKDGSLPAALWSVLAVAAIPTSVLEQPAVWILPAVSAWPLVGDLAGKHRLVVAYGLLFAVSAVPQVLVQLASPGGVRCREGGRIVEYRPHGEDEVDEWIVPDATVVGEDFPRELRKRGKAMGLAESAADVPDAVRRLILCGARERVDASRFPQLEEVVYLAPKFCPPAVNVSKGESRRERFVVGEFSACGQANYPQVEVLPGACDFMPNAVW